MKKILAPFILIAGLLIGSTPLFAHHGASVVYDLEQSVTISGVVTDFQFINPHVLIFFEVENADGIKVVWSAGLTSPNRLARNDGWTRDLFKAGDQITITGSPARGGAPSLWVEMVLDGQGKELLN
ncbi:MAG: hypothetical protein HOM55_09210 [Proteobacteria bacterium]|jgi:hypothetical protein|nr:hypothetical protein [Pseudomonadota bacterium]